MEVHEKGGGADVRGGNELVRVEGNRECGYEAAASIRWKQYCQRASFIPPICRHLVSANCITLTGPPIDDDDYY